ncbi:MAG: multicopper oxidase domain-containing protein [Oscillatoria sp. SIO1A7]|nr:multicopper oxidase domain-containing protein [Oscillatoria sp. SIO1A7]
MLEQISKLCTRRRLLHGGLSAIALALGGAAIQQRGRGQVVRVPPWNSELPKGGELISPMAMLRDFDYGREVYENGRTIREFRIEAETTTLQLNRAISYVTWNYNGRVPGPTLRAKEGDRVRVIFTNNAGHAHSMHFHGIHPAEADGVKPVRHGNSTIYEFNARPFGVHLYHCHIAPVTRHISKGLYGMFIIDPPQGRPPADEIVLVMAGYDINDDKHNEIYAFNGLPNYYRRYPIPIYQNQLVRLYLLNVIEFDTAATFHIHANFFRVYPTGMTLAPTLETDVITMGTAERHILEFSYPFVGKYMFHPHQDAIAESGCMGEFEVIA